MDLNVLREAASDCALCELHNTRVVPVFSKGNPKSKLMLCGMCPGPDENKVNNTAGKPFVGRAGKMLDQVLEDVGLEDIYITNMVKCYVKPGIRLKEEWCANCLPYIVNEIMLIKPYIVLTLGADATNALLSLDSSTKIGDTRGKIYNYFDNVFVVPTYHPSYLIRSGGKNSRGYIKMVEDLQLAMNKVFKERKVK